MTKMYQEFMITRKQGNKAMIATFRQHAFIMFIVGLMFGFIIGKCL